MRVAIAATFAGLTLVALAACGQSSNSAANGATPAAGAPAAGAGPIAAGQIPHRRPGLWRQVMGIDGPVPTSGPGITLCVDDNSEARMSAFSQSHMRGAQCAPAQMTRNLDGSISFSDSCTLSQGGKTTTTGVMHGDFNANYTVDSDTVMSGSSIPQMNGEHKMTIQATWQGPCPAGARGGDLTMPNGATRNVLDDEAKSAAAGS